MVLGFALVYILAVPVSQAADMRAAKKEGKVFWYSSVTLPIAQAVCRAFNNKKLGIKCLLHRSGSGKIYRRYLLEAKGGINVADVFHSSNAGHFLIMKKKFIRPYKPKGIEKFSPTFRTKDNSWSILRSSALVPMYNSKRSKAEDMPKSYMDFLDPKWKGKLVHAHPGYSGFITTGMIGMVKLFGWDFYRKLAKQKPMIVQSSVAPIPLVARGEVELSVGTDVYSIFNNVRKGEPLKMFFPKEGVFFMPSPNAILRKAPHPNAAEVFVDYLFSREIQQLLANNGLWVGHPDVKYPKGLPRPQDLKLIKVPAEDVRDKTKEIRKTFRRIFGV